MPIDHAWVLYSPSDVQLVQICTSLARFWPLTVLICTPHGVRDIFTRLRKLPSVEIAWHTTSLNELEGKPNVCSYMDRPRKDGGADGAPPGGGRTRRSRFRHRSCRLPRGRSGRYPRVLVPDGCGGRRGGCHHDAPGGTPRARGTGRPQRGVLGRTAGHSFHRVFPHLTRAR